MTSIDLERILVFDTTLRDGEQSPGATMTLEDKLAIATLLDHMGVDIIEAGFPAASDGDFQAVQEIARVVTNATVCGLARANENDVRRAGEAVKHAARPRIHTFIATSKLHMEKKLGLDEQGVLSAIARSVGRARTFVDDVEWSAEDATRSNIDFLCECVSVAIRSGATTINLPDTVGYAEPQEYAAMFRRVRESIGAKPGIIFSAHTHNDLGLAVSNALAAIRDGGVRQVECTINGIGERAGNSALEEIVMALSVRRDLFPFTTGIDTTMFMKASRMVAAATGFSVQPNKAIVGKNAFAHESGIHQDGMIKDKSTYEIMTPESVGKSESELIMGKHSGRNAFKQRLESLGYRLSDNEFKSAFDRFKALGDRKKHVFDEDIEAIVDERLQSKTERLALRSVHATSSTEMSHPAFVKLSIDGIDRIAASEGNGPVDAVMNAIKALIPHDAMLEHWIPQMIQTGSDAQAEVSLRLKVGDRSVSGRAVDPDTTVASAKAYLQALNKLIARGIVTLS